MILVCGKQTSEEWTSITITIWAFTSTKKIERELGIFAGRSRFGGQHPESEPETKALCSFIRAAEPDAVLTLHTQGEEIYYKSDDHAPPKGTEIGKLIADMTGYRLSDPTGTAVYGGLTDWFIKEYGKPSFTLECGKGSNPLPIEDFAGIYAKVREVLFAFPMLI